MQVRVGMSSVVLTVNPGHTLREAAKAMAGSTSGRRGRDRPRAARSRHHHRARPAQSLGAGEDPDTEKVADHLSADLTFASPEWSLERAAEAMVRGGFRHMVVVDGGEMAGVLSMRDIVRVWVSDGATSELPDDRQAAAG